MRIPAIKSMMTPFPYAIGAEATTREARERMAQHGVRHLPVLAQGKLVGVLSTRDLERAEVRAHAATARVGDVCHRPAYAVELDEPLDNVLLRMAKERLGSALVLKQGRVVGIFTTTDACLRFAEWLRRDLPFPGDDAA